ncbi:hypothetical protein QBC38DRAFT_190 [Podospora fimiseda]|uniref:Uncharacterized protein n=1 Tax=Podospora fimiseda TaxID=252190 RepID=A0AAN7H2K1_9PEZI|nr:hypothetical protein QBC38DRAFT_190 [Podospora fimiseda]
MGPVFDSRLMHFFLSFFFCGYTKSCSVTTILPLLCQLQFFCSPLDPFFKEFCFGSNCVARSSSSDVERPFKILITYDLEFPRIL